MDEVTELEPQRIFWEINAQPPYRQRQFGEQYVGLHVDWIAFFSDAAEADGEDGPGSRVRLFCRPELRSPYTITGLVASVDYPKLMETHAGVPLRLRGIIRDVDPGCIELELRAVEIDPALEPA
jgi:hypothetical protein